MLHWTPANTPDFGAFPSVAGRAVDPSGQARGEHARMLAYAAMRRRRACGEDAAYWKACAPAAVAKAALIRAKGGFRLP